MSKIIQFSIVMISLLVMLVSCMHSEVYVRSEVIIDQNAFLLPCNSIELSPKGVLYYSRREDGDTPVIHIAEGEIRNQVGNWKDSTDLIWIYLPTVNSSSWLPYERSVSGDSLLPRGNNIYKNSVFVKTK